MFFNMVSLMHWWRWNHTYHILKGNKMNRKIFILISCFVTLFPILSFGFDCNNLTFGTSLQELNKDGYFVKYMEKGGVSYYNYTGPCKMPMHSIKNPAISYAFINDQLYAQILTVSGVGIETIDPDIEKKLSLHAKSPNVKRTQEGDWVIYQGVNEKENTKIKTKINTKLRLQKGAYYYEPLRAKLKAQSQAIDPVDEVE